MRKSRLSKYKQNHCLSTFVNHFHCYNLFMSIFTPLKPLLVITLLSTPAVVFSETLEQICHEYRLEPEKIISPEDINSKKENNELSSGLYGK